MQHRPFSHALLTPSRVAGAESHNAPLLGAFTLGIEVTERELAERCGLGNIDPQHGFGLGDGVAAIAAALIWRLPPSGARLVTLRPDADAFGAMAVLNLRAKGEPLDAAALRRAALIARCDAFANGEWVSWVAERGPLPRAARPADMISAPADYAAMNALAMDRDLTPDQRVAAFEAWLVTGLVPACAREASHGYAARLAWAWNADGIDITQPYPEGPAIVRSEVPGALMLGYRVAPLVVAFAANSLPRQVTIAQFSAGHADLGAVAHDLSGDEPGWGGSPTIIGSPQGVGSRISESRILSSVLSHRVSKSLDRISAGD